MKIAGVEFNLEHHALEIYFSGCMKPRCPGCHNPELHDFRKGDQVTNEFLEEIIQKIKENELIGRVWLLGGEPLDQDPEQFWSFVHSIKQAVPSIEIWLWTKRDLEKVPLFLQRLCSHIKCGRYEKDNPSTHVEYGVPLASANQHIFKRGVDYPIHYFDESDQEDINDDSSGSAKNPD